MKFSKDTLAIFKNFASINGGIVLTEGNFVMTRSVNGATYAEATIPEEIDSELAVYDLNSFLSILSLADDGADIALNKTGDISIKSERSVINWPSADPTTIVSPKKRINFPQPNVTFDITGEDFGKIMRVSRGLGADTIAIKSTGKEIVVNAYNKISDTKLEKPLYTFQVSDYDGEEFNFIINLLNMKMIPDNYKVQLWASGDQMFASKFEGVNVSYVLAVEADSTHNFA